MYRKFRGQEAYLIFGGTAMKKVYSFIVISCFLLAGCHSNKVSKIEDSNNYLWQRYMNESEFNDLKKGLSYMDVVEIAGGEGELTDENSKKKKEVYRWPDEILMTQAYQVTFEKGKLVKKEIIELYGTSKRHMNEEKLVEPSPNM